MSPINLFPKKIKIKYISILIYTSYMARSVHIQVYSGSTTVQYCNFQRFSNPWP